MPRLRAWRPWLAGAAAAGFAGLLWNMAPVSVPPQRVCASAPEASDFQSPDAGTSAVGDTSPTQKQAPAPPAREKKPVAQEPLPEPRPGQTRPDKSGQCPGRKQVLINGARWIDVSASMSTDECADNYGALFKGKCYVPAPPSPEKPQPTSSPPEAR